MGALSGCPCSTRAGAEVRDAERVVVGGGVAVVVEEIDRHADVAVVVAVGDVEAGVLALRIEIGVVASAALGEAAEVVVGVGSAN